MVAAGEALLAPSVTRRLIAPASRYRPDTRRSRGSTAHITHPSVTAATG